MHHYRFNVFNDGSISICLVHPLFNFTFKFFIPNPNSLDHIFRGRRIFWGFVTCFISEVKKNILEELWKATRPFDLQVSGKVEFKFQVIMMHLLELKKVMFILQKEATINNGT